jgi:DNA-binding FadR family transcriptional regulator
MSAKAYVEVADRLRTMILGTELRAGDRLPSEAALAEQFQVGRSTIREALRILASQNLLVTTRGVTGGSSIAEPTPSDVADALRDHLTLLTATSSLSVSELLETRELMELPAVRLAARRRTQEDLTRIRDTIPAHVESLERSQVFTTNRDFHLRILDATGNRLLHALAEPIFTVIEHRFLSDHAPLTFWRKVMDEHAAILGSIVQGDEDQAASQMEDHLQHLRLTYEVTTPASARG